MPFGLKNSPIVFSRIIIVDFHNLIHKFLEVCTNDWTMFILLKEYIGLLRLIFDWYRQLQISLNLKKCIFCVFFGNLMGHIVFREGVLVDPVKDVIILNMPPPITAKQLQSTLGHTGYYHRFIISYTGITTPLENLLKSKVFHWTPKCGKAIIVLK
jgi:hypothetical protein